MIHPAKVLFMFFVLAPCLASQSSQSVGAETVLAELGLREYSVASRDLPGWKVPRKIVVRTLSAKQTESLRSALPGIEVVGVQSLEQASAEIADADVLLGSDVRRGLARSAQIGGPDGIAQRFQVKTHSGEPLTSKRRYNLFAKDRCRISLFDKPSEFRPQVPSVGVSFPLPGDGKRLTGTGSRPDRPIIGPTCQPKSERPATDSGEEMALVISGGGFGFDISNVPFVYVAGRDQIGGDQFPKPRGGLRIVLVIVRCHGESPAGRDQQRQPWTARARKTTSRPAIVHKAAST